MNGINAPQRPDCLAEVVGLELRNVIAKYAFESSHTAAAPLHPTVARLYLFHMLQRTLPAGFIAILYGIHGRSALAAAI